MTQPCDVLIVEDDRDVRDAVVEALTDFDYVAHGVTHGAEALARLQAGMRPRLILLDMMMPVMDGYAFRSAQREDDALRDIPIVVLTAHANPEKAAAELGAKGFLRKPVRLDDLLATVERFCPQPAA